MKAKWAKEVNLSLQSRLGNVNGTVLLGNVNGTVLLNEERDLNLKGRLIYFFKQLLKTHIDISSVSYEINFYEALFFYYHVDNTIFANGNGAEAGKLVNEFLSVKRMIYKSFNAMFHAGFYRWREFFNRISCFRQIYGGLRDASHIL